MRAIRLAVLTAAAIAMLAAVPAASAKAPKRHIAGYQRFESGNGSGETTFIVPAVQCPAEGTVYRQVSTGVILHTDAGAIVAALIGIRCLGPVPGYAGLLGLNGQTVVPDIVTPGDSVTARASGGAAGVAVTLIDHTAGWTETLVGAAADVTELAIGVSAVDCAGDGCIPVPEFADIPFTSSAVDGGTLAGLRRTPLKGKSKVEAKAIRLNKEQTDFTVTWLATCKPNANGHC